MNKLILTFLLISLSVPLFAKAHNGSFKLMDYRRGANNTFDSTIEVKYSLDSLMGEPVVKAQARYSVMGLVNINGKRQKLSREQLNKLKIVNLKLTVPFETKSIHRRLFIDINMGAMGTPGKWSYNTPGSPNWNKWIMDENGDYLSKEKAIKAYKGFLRLDVSNGLGSLAEVKSIKFNMSGAKTKAKKATPSLNGKWYRKKDNRLLLIHGTQATYPNGSKGKWKGHSVKYRNIKYVANNKWSCKSEFYQKRKGFFWDTVFIYKINSSTLKSIDLNNKIYYWLKK